jgi:signal peptide peptidase SppA
VSGFVRSLEAIAELPWALTRPALSQLVDALTHPEAAIAVVAGPPTQSYVVGPVAVIPIRGVIDHHSSWLMQYFGGCSIDQLRADLRQALADPAVTSIVLDIDSPGGNVAGVTELAAEIRAARGQKRIVAVANTMACSAAYWIASQATEVVVTPSGQAGSVGVYAVHMDYSRALEEAGVTVTIISSADHKTDGNEYEPLSDDAKADIQKAVDAFDRQFTGDVAKGRNITAAAVKANYGEGRSLLATDALAAGLVDSIETLENTVRRVARAQGSTRSAGAEIDGPDVEAEAIETPEPFRERLEHAAEELAALVVHAEVRKRLRAKEDRPAFSAGTEAALRSIRDGISALLPDEPADPPPPAVDPPPAPVDPAPAVVPPVAAAKPAFRSTEEWLAHLEGARS